MPKLFRGRRRSAEPSQHDLVHITLPRDSPFYVMRGDGNKGCSNIGASQSATSVLGISRSQEDKLAERRRARSGRPRQDHAAAGRPRALSIGDCKPSNRTYPTFRPHHICENATRNKVCHEIDAIKRSQEKLEASQSKILQILKEIHRNQKQEKEEVKDMVANVSKKVAEEVNVKFKALFGDFVDVLARFQGTITNYNSSWQKGNEKSRILDIRLEQACSNILSLNVSLDTLSSQMVAMEARLAATSQMLMESTSMYRYSHRYGGSPAVNGRCSPCCQQRAQNKQQRFMALPPYPAGDDESFWSYLDRSASTTSTEYGSLLLGSENRMDLNEHNIADDGGDHFRRPLSENLTVTAETTTIPSGFLSRTESFEADAEERLIDISAAGDYIRSFVPHHEKDAVPIDDKSGNVPGSCCSMSVIDSTESTAAKPTAANKATDVSKNASIKAQQGTPKGGDGPRIESILPPSPLQNRPPSSSPAPAPKFPSYFRGSRRLANLQKVRNCRHSTDTEASMSSDLLMSDVISSLSTDTIENGTRSFDHSVERAGNKATARGVMVDEVENQKVNDDGNKNDQRNKEEWEQTATANMSTTLTGTSDTYAERKLNEDGNEDETEDGNQQNERIQHGVASGGRDAHAGRQCCNQRKLMAPRQLIDTNSMSDTCASYSEDFELNVGSRDDRIHPKLQTQQKLPNKGHTGFIARQPAGNKPSGPASVASSSCSSDMACIGSTICDLNDGTEL